jgi:hypothetical protein
MGFLFDSMRGSLLYFIHRSTFRRCVFMLDLAYCDILGSYTAPVLPTSPLLIQLKVDHRHTFMQPWCERM